MAYSENDVPVSVRDILAHMPREMSQRVLADYETHYAPFLSMLAGWKGAVQQHYAQGEASAIARLEEQFFPLGTWKFPAQTLAVPQRAPERTTEIPSESEFADPAGRPWLSSGGGWLQPTTLRSAAAQWVNNDCFFVLEADCAGSAPLDSVLRRGQLLLAAMPEEVIAALAGGEWWALTPGGAGYRRARLTRYDGYMDFEREIQTARMQQRHLDLWLPPCHPYSRKIVCLSLSDENGTPEPPDLSWLGRDLRTGFRFVGALRKPDRRSTVFLREAGGRGAATPLVYLNAVPVIQTALVDSTFYPPFPRVGQEYALRLSGIPDLFAATAMHDAHAVPVSMARLPSTDPLAKEPDVQVQFSQSEAGVVRIKLYYQSFGQGRGGDKDAPTLLEKTPLRFDVPFPLLGGATVGGPEGRAEWVRSAWYHSVLRPPLLSEGDVREIIRQREGSLGSLLRFRDATREILHDPEEGSAHWRSYLWPSVLAREDSFDARYGEIPSPHSVPLIQSLRLTFERASSAGAVPAFLLSDVANYLASILSQYFVLSCFRVEGRVV